MALSRSSLASRLERRRIFSFAAQWARFGCLAQLHWIESTEPIEPGPLAKIVAVLQAREMAKPPEPWRAINPYRGLVALDEQDADFFFGRESGTRKIIDKIIAAPGRLRFGPSGSPGAIGGSASARSSSFCWPRACGSRTRPARCAPGPQAGHGRHHRAAQGRDVSD
jgi:hypothetical protein